MGHRASDLKTRSGLAPEPLGAPESESRPDLGSALSLESIFQLFPKRLSGHPRILTGGPRCAAGGRGVPNRPYEQRVGLITGAPTAEP